MANFRALNVCRVANWEEIRLQGKFMRLQDADDSTIEAVVSRWYYKFEVAASAEDTAHQTHLIITIH